MAACVELGCRCCEICEDYGEGEYKGVEGHGSQVEIGGALQAVVTAAQ